MPSTVISTFYYDESQQNLYVTFVSGQTYIYKEVPLEVFGQMKASRAKGVFLNQHIKGRYECARCNFPHPDTTPGENPGRENQN